MARHKPGLDRDRCLSWGARKRAGNSCVLCVVAACAKVKGFCSAIDGGMHARECGNVRRVRKFGATYDPLIRSA
jgi:hypothetical protein